MSTSISSGDFDSWYASYAGRLRAPVRRIVGNTPDAEDAVQEAFLAAFRARDRFTGGDPYPWLYRIATRKALNIVAERRGPAAMDVPEPAAPSAEDEALSRLRAGALRDMLDAEPVVALHLLGGLRFREIGAHYGAPVATAATWVRRGKRRLRARLQATMVTLPESKPA